MASARTTNLVRISSEDPTLVLISPMDVKKKTTDMFLLQYFKIDQLCFKLI